MGQSHLVTKLRNMLRFILLVFCLSYVTAEPYSGPLASIENRGGQATVVEHHSPYGYAQSGQYVAVNPGAVHHAKRSVYTLPTMSISYQGGVPTVEGHHTPYGYAKAGKYVAVNPGAVHHAKRSVDTLPTLSITYQGGVPTTVGRHTPYGYAKSGEYVAVNPGAVHYAKRSPWTGECVNNLGKSVECDPVQPTAYAGVPQTGVPEAVVPWNGECVNYLGQTVDCRGF